MWSNFNDANAKDEETITPNSKSSDSSLEESISFVGKEVAVDSCMVLENFYEALEGDFVQDALIFLIVGAHEEIDMRSAQAQIELATGKLVILLLLGFVGYY